MRADIQDFARKTPSICGTLLLAPEGINGTIGASSEDMTRMIDFLDEKLGIRAGELKYSAATEKPFNKFKVRPKKEVITLKRPEANPNIVVGTYVEPKDWNDLVADPDVILLDTRNDYETKVGIFKGSIDPQIKVFTEFPDWVEKHLNPAKHKKIAMFCTGGIRCEKASSYMLANGFEEVYHLKGGILKYLEEIPAEQSIWDGECFVFDKRVAVGHALKESGSWTICHGCREPLSEEETKLANYEKGVSCLHCADGLAEDRASMLRLRQKQYEARFVGAQ